MSTLPDAPYTVAQCAAARRTAEMLAKQSSTVAKREYWENIVLQWSARLVEAKERENANAS